MSTFILYVDKNSNIDENQIKRLEKNHQTPQDKVIRVYTDESLPNGFAISKDDNLVEVVAKGKPDLQDRPEVAETIRKQKKFLRKQAEYSKDTTLTDGAKPI